MEHRSGASATTSTITVGHFLVAPSKHSHTMHFAERIKITLRVMSTLSLDGELLNEYADWP